MASSNYIRALGVAFALASATYFGYKLGRYHEGNARCLKDGIEEHFAVDFPGYNPNADLSDPKDEKLMGLRVAYMSGELSEDSEPLTPAEQAYAINKGRRAKYEVETACKKDNQAH